MNENVLKKVTVFVTREKNGKVELLLFRHPHAGIQIPAGTVELGEEADKTAIREMNEETGIKDYDEIECIGKEEIKLDEGYAMVYTRPNVYSRPNKSSFDWCTHRRGIKVV